jgi:hypothetical protein
MHVRTLDTTFLNAAAWLASDAAMRAVQVKESSLSEASPTPPMMGMRAAYTIGWSMSCVVMNGENRWRGMGG